MTGAVRKEVVDETDRVTGKSKMISPIPIHLSIYSPNGNDDCFVPSCASPPHIETTWRLRAVCGHRGHLSLLKGPDGREGGSAVGRQSRKRGMGMGMGMGTESLIFAARLCQIFYA